MLDFIQVVKAFNEAAIPFNACIHMKVKFQTTFEEYVEFPIVVETEMFRIDKKDEVAPLTRVAFYSYKIDTLDSVFMKACLEEALSEFAYRIPRAKLTQDAKLKLASLLESAVNEKLKPFDIQVS